MSGGCRLATRAVRAGIDCDTAFGAVTPPLVLSSNFSFAGFNDKRKYDYTRSGNPTRDLLGEALAGLEGGAGAVVTSTGMSAITLVLLSVVLLISGFGVGTFASRRVMPRSIAARYAASSRPSPPASSSDTFSSSE